jgi:[ribosomal protein S5]-alanine N-acetyltransferase
MEIKSNDSRVCLRTLTPDDADGLVAVANYEDVSYNMVDMARIPYPFTRRDALIFIDMASKAQMYGGALNFGIVVNKNVVGAMVLKLDLNNKSCEIGYWIGRDHRRKGYAKEAIKLTLSFVFGTLRFNRVQAKTLTSNEPSINLLGAMGFAREGVRRQRLYHQGKFLDDILFSILSGEFDGRMAYDVKE